MVSLTRYERRILSAFAATLLPKTGLLSETPEEVRLVEKVQQHLGYLPRNVRFIFRLALVLFESGGILYGGRPFSFLKEPEKERYLQIWKKSFVYSMRLLVKLIESVCYMNYYAHPEVSKKLGFVPPPIRHSSNLPPFIDSPDKDLFLKADVCVIGAGAGGAVVAKELAEKGRSVVILEEGGYFNINDFGKDPLETLQKIYRNGGLQLTLGFPCILLPTGRAVGGTTIINSGTCFRLPEKVFARWQREFGLTDVRSEGLAPYFDRVEEHLHVVPVEEEVLGNNSKVFRRGLERLGFKGASLRRNVKECKGSGMCCFGCPTDAKQSVHLSYIPRAIEKGAKLFAHCRAENIFPRLEHGGEVVGRFRDPITGKHGKTIRVDAKVIVLAAGTLNTPHLLRKNHIAIFNRHIGRHLTIHPASKVMALFDEEIRGWEGVPQGFSFDGMASEGILFEGAFTPPSASSINLSLPPRLHKEVMEKFRHLAAFGFLMSDEGRGWIRWLPNGDPVAYYSIRRKEVAKFVKAHRFLTEVFLAAGAKRVFPCLPGIPEVTSTADLKKFDRIRVWRNDLELSAFHPLGTCRMGADPDESVVDSYVEMHYVKNLFIADGSIFPSPLSVNPQETIMAFANRTADYIDRERL